MPAKTRKGDVTELSPAWVADWYVAPALRGRFAILGTAVAALAFAGCGGGGERQDANEPEGDFRVEVVRAEFPERQKLAKRSRLEIVLRNADDREIPNIAVTLNGLDRRKDNPELADQRRPVFVVNGRFEEFGNIEDAQSQTPDGIENPSYVNTWSLGPLAPGESKSFEWDVTAVWAGPYELDYTVAAGLTGKARAVDENGEIPRGVFTGRISDDAPQTRIAADGESIVPVRPGEEAGGRHNR